MHFRFFLLIIISLLGPSTLILGQVENSEAPPTLLELFKSQKIKATTYPAPRFENTSNAFYRNGEWLAINPDEHRKATAGTSFEEESGTYDVILVTVGENDGRSQYQLFVNNKGYGSYRPRLATEPFEEGLAYCKLYRNVSLNPGDQLSVAAEIKSHDGKEYSRGRWSGLVTVPAGQANSLIEAVRADQASRFIGTISESPMKWHRVSLDFTGPSTAEDDDYNPFMNYRLNVTFTHKASGKSYLVPGFFAADGDAGQTSATAGDTWRVHFAPDETGTWEYAVSFRKGQWSAVSESQDTGESGEYMDGAEGSFSVSASDKTGRDFRAHGRLQYVGKRYLKFAESGTYFLKQGPDAPENFLSYADFDGTFHQDGHGDKYVKTWDPHLKDWADGNPTWKAGQGKAIIGALNYLADKGLNSVSFLTNNIEGDDKNVFPYTDYTSYDRFDVSKLDQWDIVFAHAQSLGLFLHFKLMEVENQGLLDNGGVGANTKLYYREMMARFGHHLALNWNLGEENGEWRARHVTPPQGPQQRLAMTKYFKDHDPYRHHLVIHNGDPFDDLLGPESGLTGPSVQTHKADFREVHSTTLHWLNASRKAGFQWAVAVDEPGDAQHSLLPDAENPDHDMARRNGLWGTFMAGGWGNEWYFGYAHPQSDLTCNDYRSRDLFWNQAAAALGIFKDQGIPFWSMSNRNDLVANTDNENTVYCLADPGEVYLIYFNSVSTASLDLKEVSGNYQIKWFDGKTGKMLTDQGTTVRGGTSHTLSYESAGGFADRIALITRIK